MFDTFVAAKTTRTTRRATWIAAIAAGLHVAVGGGLIAKQFWTLRELERPRESVFGLAAPPPPAAAAGGSTKKLEKKEIEKVDEPVQPTEEVKLVERTDDANDDSGEDTPGIGIPEGSLLGEIGGVAGGDVGGHGTEPVATAAAKNVPLVALKALRISGDAQIQPPNDVNVKIRRAGKSVTGVVKMCLSKTGAVEKTKVLRSTGHPSYDDKIQDKMRAWRYRPYKVNGQAVSVCTAVTFIYRPN